MQNVFAEKVRKDQVHDEKSDNRGEKTPEHTEVGALVLLLEVALDKLGEKKIMLAESLEHNAMRRGVRRGNAPFLKGSVYIVP